jgi:hypothetical protein
MWKEEMECSSEMQHNQRWSLKIRKKDGYKYFWRERERNVRVALKEIKS